MKEAHVVIRIEQKKLAQLKRIAKKQDLSVSWLIRKAIDRLIKEGPDADKH
jgi:hypothetical protein